MMHYVDVRILPDPEFVPGVLLNALTAKLHRALVQQNFNTIGVGFPKKPTKGLGLGTVLRLHGPQQDLQKLMDSSWLKGMRDHVKVSDVAAVPPNHKQMTVRRKQAKSNAMRQQRRLARRLAAREGIDFEQAMRKVGKPKEKRLDLPFLQMKSASTGQNFRLFILQQETESAPISGEFDCYGLSKTATLPAF